MMLNQKGFSIIFILLGLVAVIAIIGGTYYLGKFQIPKPQPKNPPVISETQQPTPTASPILNASPVLNNVDETANWKVYANQKFGFSMKYPPDWKVIENDSNHVWVSNKNNETLIIGVKNSTDTIEITKSGTVVIKDLVNRGEVEFLQQPVGKDVLVFQGNDMSVMYDQAREIIRGNLVFALSLDKTIMCPLSLNAPCPKILSTNSENIVDKILSTFTLLDQNKVNP